MKRFIVFAPFLALCLAAPPAFAAQAAAKPTTEASIPFANRHGVRDWVAQGDQTIYFEDYGRHWYRAELFAPSPDLQFTQVIGYDTGPIGTLDKWSMVVIRGVRYPLQSFERVDGPPTKADKAAKPTNTP